MKMWQIKTSLIYHSCQQIYNLLLLHLKLITPFSYILELCIFSVLYFLNGRIKQKLCQNYTLQILHLHSKSNQIIHGYSQKILDRVTIHTNKLQN